MKSRATSAFWDCYKNLPEKIKERARSVFQLWLEDHFHPSLHFKRLTPSSEDIWSVRIGISWRALGLREGDMIVWFWIGSHADYDHLVG